MHYMMNPLVNLLGRVLSEDGPANGVMFMESCMDSVLAIFREVSRRAKVNIARPIHSVVHFSDFGVTPSPRTCRGSLRGEQLFLRLIRISY